MLIKWVNKWIRRLMQIPSTMTSVSFLAFFVCIFVTFIGLIKKSAANLRHFNKKKKKKTFVNTSVLFLTILYAL